MELTIEEQTSIVIFIINTWLILALVLLSIHAIIKEIKYKDELKVSRKRVKEVFSKLWRKR